MDRSTAKRRSQPTVTTIGMHHARTQNSLCAIYLQCQVFCSDCGGAAKSNRVKVVPNRMSSAFVNSFARGYGGTNVSMVSYAAKERSS